MSATFPWPTDFYARLVVGYVHLRQGFRVRHGFAGQHAAVAPSVVEQRVEPWSAAQVPEELPGDLHAGGLVRNLPALNDV
ncbi:MAG TPA: hypothetical protein VFB74_16900, partial [Kribbellaceae bacterium]|nr:hypothetical protein [Kribbellaceae bacterium]